MDKARLVINETFVSDTPEERRANFRSAMDRCQELLSAQAAAHETVGADVCRSDGSKG